jgi:YfiR/HmsC-like
MAAVAHSGPKVRIQQHQRQPKRKSRWAAPCVRALLLTLALAFSYAQEAHPTATQVKAAYLYNFGKFVRWSGERAASPTFEICIMGKDPFGTVLDETVAGERIDGKQIAVLRLPRMQDATGCKVLYISVSEEGRLTAILSASKQMNLLTVSDIPGFAERGGTIGLVLQQDRIRFEVNRRAAEQCHLTLSSELLKVATRVLE